MLLFCFVTDNVVLMLQSTPTPLRPNKVHKWILTLFKMTSMIFKSERTRWNTSEGKGPAIPVLVSVSNIHSGVLCCRRPRNALSRDSSRVAPRKEATRVRLRAALVSGERWRAGCFFTQPQGAVGLWFDTSWKRKTASLLLHVNVCPNLQNHSHVFVALSSRKHRIELASSVMFIYSTKVGWICMYMF